MDGKISECYNSTTQSQKTFCTDSLSIVLNHPNVAKHTAWAAVGTADCADNITVLCVWGGGAVYEYDIVCGL